MICVLCVWVVCTFLVSFDYNSGYVVWGLERVTCSVKAETKRMPLIMA